MGNGQRLYTVVYDYIKELISSKKLNPNDILPTEKELVAQLNVSRITVQKAMSMLVDDGYVMRTAGKGTFVKEAETDKGRKNIIGVVLSDMDASFGMDILVAIEKMAFENGYNVIFKNSRHFLDVEKQSIIDLENAQVSGIIIQPIHGEIFNPEILRLVLNGFPIVSIDRYIKGLSMSYVGTDNKASTLKAMEYLFENGHKSIAFFCSNPDNTTTIEERIDGFNLAFIKNCLINFPQNFYKKIKSTSIRHPSNQVVREDIDGIKKALSQCDATCIFTAEAPICRLVMTALKEMGKRVPEDISVITFDKDYANEQLTHIEQKQCEIGEKAFSALIKILNNESSGEKILIESELVLKASVKKLN